MFNPGRVLCGAGMPALFFPFPVWMNYLSLFRFEAVVPFFFIYFSLVTVGFDLLDSGNSTSVPRAKLFMAIPTPSPLKASSSPPSSQPLRHISEQLWTTSRPFYTFSACDALWQSLSLFLDLPPYPPLRSPPNLVLTLVTGEGFLFRLSLPSARRGGVLPPQ